MTDLASLSLEINSTPIQRAQVELDRLTAIGAKTEEQVNALEQAQRRLNLEMSKAEVAAQNVGMRQTTAAVAAEKNAEALSNTEVAAQKALNRYDPLGAKLRQLQTDFTLLRSVMGDSTDTGVARAFGNLEDQMTKTQTLMAQAGLEGPVAFEKIATGANLSGLATSRARMHLMMLGREVATGEFSRVPNTLMGIAMYAHLSAEALFTVVAPVLAVVGGLVALAVAAVQGAKEMREMNKALAITNNYAGQTRDSMRVLALDMASAGTITIGTSKTIVTELVNSGRIGADALMVIGKLAADYAAATGKDVAKLGPDLVKLFEDPVKGAEELNKQMHFLTPAELAHIKMLQQMGEEDRAQLELAQKLAPFLEKNRGELGLLETAWDKVKSAASFAWDAMLGLRREEPLAEQLAKAQADVRVAENRARYAPERGAAALDQARQAVSKIQEQQVAKALQVRADSEGALINRQQNRSADLVNQTSEYTKIAKLTADIAVANRFDAQTSEEKLNKTRAIHDLEKQRRDMYIQIGAEGKALAEERIAGALKLYEVDSKGDTARVTAEVALSNMTKAEGEQAKIAINLRMNEQQQLAVSQRMRLANLQIEKDKLVVELRSLAAQHNQLQDAAQNAALIERQRITKLQSDMDITSQQNINELQLKTIAGYDTEIEKLTLHNAGIGKTKDAVDLLKVAEIDRQIVVTQLDWTLNEQNADYIANLDAQLEKLKTIRQLMLDGAAQEKQLAQNKQGADSFMKMFNEVERQGKAAFVAVFSHGKGAMEAIGVAIKTSIIDVLYQLTLHRWIMNVGLNVAQSMGVNVAGSALSSAGGSMLGSLGGSTLGNLGFGSNIGGGLYNSFATSGVGQSLGLSTMDMSLVGESFAGEAGLGGLTTLGTALPYAGAALAVASALGLFGGGGGPKGSSIGLVPSGLNNEGVHFTQADVTDSSWGEAFDKQFIAAFNAMGPKAQEFLKAQIGKAWSAGGPESAQNMVAQYVQPLLDQAKAIDQAAADSAAAVSAINAQQRQLDIQLMQAQGNASGALAAQRQIELDAMDASLRVTAQAIYNAQDLATAQQNLNQAQSSAVSAIRGLSGTLGIDALVAAQQGMATSEYLSPSARLVAAQSQLSSTYTSAMGGDLGAAQNFPTMLQNVLTIGRDVYASGSGFQQLFLEGNRQLNELLTKQRETQTDIMKDIPVSIQEGAANTVAALRTGFQELKDQLANVTAELRRLAA